MMPGENAPPMHPNCRCSVSAWDDAEEYEKWLDYLDKGGSTEEWNNRIRISSPSSTESYKRSLTEIAAGKAGLDKRRTNIINRLSKSGDYHRYEKESISTRDLAYLSAATGNEFALFRSKNHDILIRGDARTCDIIGELGDEILNNKYKWIAHSHVDKGTLTASIQDRHLLRMLDQKKSILVGIDGGEKTYGQTVFDD